MILKILKSGKFALHPAQGPIVDLIADENADNDEPAVTPYVANVSHGENLIKEGWAEEEIHEDEQIDEPEDEDEDLDDLDNDDENEDDDPPKFTIEEANAALKALIEDIEDEDEQKNLIKDWGDVNAGVKPSRAKTVENMIAEICDSFAE